jgi:hypothetical protein
MASGCIIGECPVCGEHIYEDEWLLVDDVLIHEECRHKNKKHVRIMRDLQKRLLAAEKEIKVYRNALRKIHESDAEKEFYKVIARIALEEGLKKRLM